MGEYSSYGRDGEDCCPHSQAYVKGDTNYCHLCGKDRYATCDDYDDNEEF